MHMLKGKWCSVWRGVLIIGWPSINVFVLLSLLPYKLARLEVSSITDILIEVSHYMQYSVQCTMQCPPTHSVEDEVADDYEIDGGLTAEYGEHVRRHSLPEVYQEILHLGEEGREGGRV